MRTNVLNSVYFGFAQKSKVNENSGKNAINIYKNRKTEIFWQRSNYVRLYPEWFPRKLFIHSCSLARKASTNKIVMMRSDSKLVIEKKAHQSDFSPFLRMDGKIEYVQTEFLQIPIIVKGRVLIMKRHLAARLVAIVSSICLLTGCGSKPAESSEPAEAVEASAEEEAEKTEETKPSNTEVVYQIEGEDEPSDENTEDTEEVTDEPFTFPDIASMDSVAGAVIFYCVMDDSVYWNPSAGNAGDFWNTMYYYANAERGIIEMNPQRTGDNSEYMILPDRVFVNAGYAAFSDFDGELPAPEDIGDRVKKADKNSTAVLIGDPIHVERGSVIKNDDHTVDAVYSYNDGEFISEYKLHMTVNSNYNKANDHFTYYYTIEDVKLTNSKKVPKTESETEAEGDSVVESGSESKNDSDAASDSDAGNEPEAGKDTEAESSSDSGKDAAVESDSSADSGSDMDGDSGADSDPDTGSDSGAEAHPAFYGIWCGAFKDKSAAERLASSVRERGFPAEVFVSTDWGNLNSDKWYVVSAGTYDSKEEAEKVLPEVKKYFESAYIKYSGEWLH